MTPLKLKHTDKVLGVPDNWDARYGTCRGLPVMHEPPNYYSYWYVTWKERLAILFGRPVRLNMMASAHPPVHLDTERV